MKRSLTLIAAAMLASLLALPAQAKRKPPADPGAQICELDWRANFGKIEVKQTWSSAGELTREELGIWRDDGNGGILSLSRQSVRIDGKKQTSQSILLNLGGRQYDGKDLRLVIALPDGELMSVALNATGSASLSEAQLTRLISAKGWLLYRVITVDQRGVEKQQVRSGWMDLSGFAGQPLAGLLEAADRASAVLTQARKSANPPCVMAEVAETNQMDSGEPTRRSLSFDCGETWEGRLGMFELRETKYRWRSGQRYSVTVSMDGDYRPSPRVEQQQFLNAPREASRFRRISIGFGAKDWGANYRSSDPTQRERQVAELHRGKYVARRWFLQNGSADFYEPEFSQILMGEGDIEFVAHDKITGATQRGTLPWADVLAADEELRAGLRRLIERERDPMTRCKTVADEELGTEAIIVT